MDRLEPTQNLGSIGAVDHGSEIDEATNVAPHTPNSIEIPRFSMFYRTVLVEVVQMLSEIHSEVSGKSWF